MLSLWTNRLHDPVVGTFFALAIVAFLASVLILGAVWHDFRHTPRWIMTGLELHGVRMVVSGAVGRVLQHAAALGFMAVIAFVTRPNRWLVYALFGCSQYLVIGNGLFLLRTQRLALRRLRQQTGTERAELTTLAVEGANGGRFTLTKEHPKHEERW